MARKRSIVPQNRQRRGWVQDTTLYIPPTSTVTDIHLRPEWSALTSQRLAKLLKLKPR